MNGLLSASAFEVAESAASFRLLSGAMTIDDGFLLALMKPAGEAYAENAVITLDGVDITDRVTSGPTISTREGDTVQRITLACDDDLSYLDDSIADFGKTVRVTHQVRNANTGEYHSYRLFTGKVRSISQDMTVDGEATMLDVSGLEEDIAKHDLTINLNLEANPYNVVIAGVGDEIDIIPLDTTTTFTLKSGAVLIDKSNIGNWNTNPGNGGYGGYIPYVPYIPPPPAGNSSTGIVRFDIAQTTFDLNNLPNVTMDDDQVLGLKTIFCNVNGYIDATDGGAPPDGVPLWAFDLEYIGQPLTKDRFVDVRVLTIEYEKRTRAEIAKYILDREGFSVSAFKCPSVYNDRVNNNIVWGPKQPLMDFLQQWGEPSLWNFTVDQVGNPTYVLNKIARVGNTEFEYHKGHYATAHVSSPDANSTVDVTVRGVSIVNNGLVGRTETSETVSRAEIEEPPTVGAFTLGGQYVPYDQAGEKRLKIVQRTREKRKYYGNSVVSEKISIERRRNPIATSNGAGTPSAERNLNHKYYDPNLELDEINEITHVYRNRIYRGYSREVKKYINPITHNSTGAYAYGGGVVGNNYGFQFAEDTLTLTDVTNFRINPTTNGFIKDQWTEQWALGNPHVGPSENEAVRYPGTTNLATSAGAGFHAEKERLIKMAEASEAFERYSREEIKITRHSRSWRKRAGSIAHGNFAAAPGPSSGTSHAQGSTTLTAAEHTVEIKKGSLPALQALEDDIDRIPVGFRCYSPTLATTFGSDKVIDIEHQFAESTEMCERLARKTLGRAIALEWTINVGCNPLITRWDTIGLIFQSRGGIDYNIRGLVTGVAHKLATEAKEESGTLVTMAIDYNDVRTILATRP